MKLFKFFYLWTSFNLFSADLILISKPIEYGFLTGNENIGFDTQPTTHDESHQLYYVGLGAEQNYTILAQEKLKNAILYDVDLNVIKSHLIHLFFIKKSKNKEQWIQFYHTHNLSSSIQLLQQIKLPKVYCPVRNCLQDKISVKDLIHFFELNHLAYWKRFDYLSQLSTQVFRNVFNDQSFFEWMRDQVVVHHLFLANNNETKTNIFLVLKKYLKKNDVIKILYLSNSIDGYTKLNDPQLMRGFVELPTIDSSKIYFTLMITKEDYSHIKAIHQNSIKNKITCYHQQYQDCSVSEIKAFFRPTVNMKNVFPFVYKVPFIEIFYFDNKGFDPLSNKFSFSWMSAAVRFSELKEALRSHYKF